MRGPKERRQRGAALLEFVLVIPLFIYILYSMIAFGLVLTLKEDVTHAASEGARAAIGAPGASPTYTTPWTTAATNRVTSVLSWLGPNAAFVTPTATDPVGVTVAACIDDPSHECITVSVKYSYSNHPIVPNLPGLGVVFGQDITSTAVVQVQ